MNTLEVQEILFSAMSAGIVIGSTYTAMRIALRWWWHR